MKRKSRGGSGTGHGHVPQSELLKGVFVPDDFNTELVCILLIDKQEPKTRPTYECRYDERLKTKDEESTRLGYTGYLLFIMNQ